MKIEVETEVLFLHWPFHAVLKNIHLQWNVELWCTVVLLQSADSRSHNGTKSVRKAVLSAWLQAIPWLWNVDIRVVSGAIVPHTLRIRFFLVPIRDYQITRASLTLTESVISGLFLCTYQDRFSFLFFSYFLSHCKST